MALDPITQQALNQTGMTIEQLRAENKRRQQINAGLTLPTINSVYNPTQTSSTAGAESAMLQQYMAQAALAKKQTAALSKYPKFSFDEGAAQRKAEIDFNAYYDKIRADFMVQSGLKRQEIGLQYGQTTERAGLTKESELGQAGLATKEAQASFGLGTEETQMTYTQQKQQQNIEQKAQELGLREQLGGMAALSGAGMGAIKQFATQARISVQNAQESYLFAKEKLGTQFGLSKERIEFGKGMTEKQYAQSMKFAGEVKQLNTAQLEQEISGTLHQYEQQKQQDIWEAVMNQEASAFDRWQADYNWFKGSLGL